MPRNSYYANQGNPLKLGSTPRLNLPLEFPIVDVNSRTNRRFTGYLLICLIALDTAVLFGGFILDFAAIGFLGLTTVGIIAETWIRTPAERKFVRHYMLKALALVLLTWFLTLFGEIALLVPAAHLSCVSIAFAYHWVHRCLASPLSREDAERYAKKWSWQMNVAAATPILAVFLAILFRNPILFPLLTIIFALIQVIQSGGFHLSKELLIRSLTSFLTYNNNDNQTPGLFQSPIGPSFNRKVTLFGGAITFSWLMLVIAATDSGIRFANVLSSHFILPSPAFFLLTPMLVLPVLDVAFRKRSEEREVPSWSTLVKELRASTNPHARDSYYMGQVDSDGSPLLVPRSIFNEHAHFLGSSGSGKTARGLNPWIEQTVRFGDVGLVVLDQKADSLELLATTQAAIQAKYEETGQVIPLKVFSNQDHLPTYGFNPFAYSFWNSLNIRQRTDIICASLGLLYGTDYGTGYFSAANSALMYETLRRFPEAKSFREYADGCSYLMKNKSKSNLDSKLLSDGIQLLEELKRMADFEQMQVGDSRSRASQKVVDDAIDLSDLFRRPQVLYLHLSASQSASSAPAIARLFTYMLLTCASQTKRECQVYLVIDEFQRMVAQNLEFVLQLARSMNVGVILANQSMADLRTLKADMRSALETNCRYRQWFDVPSREDRDALQAVAGETVESLSGVGVTRGENGSTNSWTSSEAILPRINVNEINIASDDPDLSIVRISRGHGYAQYAGFPIVVRSGFHVSRDEYERRRASAWPEKNEGMFIPAENRAPTNLDSFEQLGPSVIIESDSPAEQLPPIDELDQLFEDLGKKERPRKKRKKEDDE